MRRIKEILRLKFDLKLSLRHIALSLKIGLGTVKLHLDRASKAGISWPLPTDMDDQALEAALFPNRGSPLRSRVEPDYALMHKELKRKGLTKQLLWEEYKQTHGDSGYQYSQYCQYYRAWVGTRLSK